MFEESLRDYDYACALAQDPFFYNYGLQYYIYSQKKKFAIFPVLKDERLETNEETFTYDGTNKIKIKVYSNKTLEKNKMGNKCLVYAHGGGFVAGGFELVDGLCQDLVFDLDVTVIAIDYRSAPKFRHPVAIYDCAYAISYIRENAQRFGINDNEIYFGGESSGGFIAMILPAVLQDLKKPQLAGVISINPVLDVLRWARREVKDCNQEFQDEMHFFTSTYLGDKVNDDCEYFSTLNINDSYLRKYPPCVLFAAKKDPLSKEACLMYEKLKKNKIKVYLHIDEYAIHGSIRARRYYIFAKNAYEALLTKIKKIMESEDEQIANS